MASQPPSVVFAEVQAQFRSAPGRLLPVLLLVLALAAPVQAASGVQGGALWRGQAVAQVTVRAYRSLADLAGGRPLTPVATTDGDGSFRLELPPGQYYLTARNGSGPLRPGDYFCYYNGSPVQVGEGGYSPVGFNLIRVPAEAPPVAGKVSGIRGELTFQGQPLQRAYLYVYKDPGEDFKGPGYFVQPVEKGSFRLRLPPGDYYLLARKRAKGGQFGPLEIGDYFNYYYGNPVHIEAGQVREVRLETIARQALPADAVVAARRGVHGRLLGPGGVPAPGLHVFAYRDAAMTGTPACFSPASAADGTFELSLADDGPFYLLAREAFGGPAEAGEWYGRLGEPVAEGLRLDTEHPLREVTIHVAKKPAP